MSEQQNRIDPAAAQSHAGLSHARLKAWCEAATDGADPYRANAEHQFDADQYEQDVKALVAEWERALIVRDKLLTHIRVLETKYGLLGADRNKLLAFKQYVHARLDAAGVSPDPDGPHKAEGCRVGGRLDEVFLRITELEDEVKKLTEERDELRKRSG